MRRSSILLCLSRKKLVRVISYSCAFNHTDPLLSQLRLLKIKELNIYTRCNFIYKCVNNLNNCNWFEYYTNEYDTRIANNSNQLIKFSFQAIIDVRRYQGME